MSRYFIENLRISHLLMYSFIQQLDKWIHQKLCQVVSEALGIQQSLNKIYLALDIFELTVYWENRHSVSTQNCEDMKIRKYGVIRRSFNLIWKGRQCLLENKQDQQIRNDVEEKTLLRGENIILECIKTREYDAFEDLKEEQDGWNRKVKNKNCISCR